MLSSGCSRAATLRALLIWLGCAAATATLGALSLDDLAAARLPRAGFAPLLVAGCAMAATAACALLLVGTTSVLVTLRTGRAPARVGPLRRAILAACGAAAIAATPMSAHAGPATHHTTTLGGLPLPDRATGGAVRPAPTAVVRPGDSLWSIAGRHLPGDAPASAVAAYTARIYAHNAPTIGPDPDVILPGQQLRLPPTTLDR